MANVLITLADLAPFADIDEAKAKAMIADATATALRVAPCLKDTADADTLAAAKAVLRAAILRWNDAGTGEIQQVTAGSFTVSHGQVQRKSLFWPSEINQLQELCQGDSGAFAIDTAPQWTTWHSDFCNLVLGGVYCSCGATIAGYPIYEPSDLP